MRLLAGQKDRITRIGTRVHHSEGLLLQAHLITTREYVCWVLHGLARHCLSRPCSPHLPAKGALTHPPFGASPKATDGFELQFLAAYGAKNCQWEMHLRMFGAIGGPKPISRYAHPPIFSPHDTGG